ncbi:MAG: molybdate ABC transporter substrate-binding protein [Collinsella sp.]
MPEVQALHREDRRDVRRHAVQASGDLIEQIRAGAQADALITASKGTMDDAVAGGLVDEATRLDMFVNDLVVVKAEGSDAEIASLLRM